MTEIDIEKKCEKCLLRDECSIKELDTSICVWYFDEDKFEIREVNKMLYIEEVVR